MKHVARGTAVILHCQMCGDVLIHNCGKFPHKKGWICRHCKTKSKYGASDPESCFQGSVITLED